MLDVSFVAFFELLFYLAANVYFLPELGLEFDEFAFFVEFDLFFFFEEYMGGQELSILFFFD